MKLITFKINNISITSIQQLGIFSFFSGRKKKNAGCLNKWKVMKRMVLSLDCFFFQLLYSFRVINSEFFVCNCVQFCIYFFNGFSFFFQILEVKSPVKQNKSDKQIKNGDCDKVNANEKTVNYSIFTYLLKTKYFLLEWKAVIATSLLCVP